MIENYTTSSLMYQHRNLVALIGRWKGFYITVIIPEGVRLHSALSLHLRGMSVTLFSAVAPHTLYFGVKFYAADPCKLHEEITR